MNRQFFHSIAILSAGNVLAQIIHGITYLVLPRFFYSPGEFGWFGLFLALYFIFFEIVNLKMDQAIMLPSGKDEAAGLLHLSWVLAIALSAGVFLIVWTAGQLSDRIPPGMAPLLGASLLAGGLLQPAQVWLNRQGRYLAMGGIRVVQALTTLGASVLAWYLFRESVNGLALGFAAGLFVAAALSLSFTGKLSRKVAARGTVSRYGQFLRYGSASSLISTLSRQLPVFAIRPFFGEAALGWYTLAVKYLNAPIGLLTAAVGQVYYRDASKASPQELARLTRGVVGNLLVLALIPAAVVALAGPPVVEWVFGEAWRPAGRVMQVLILWYYIAYATGPVSMLLDVKLRLRWELMYNILLLAGRAAALALVWVWRDFYLILGLYALVGLLFNGWLLIYILRLSDNHER